MEPISLLLSTAVGYILKGAAQSKTADEAKEQILGGFWKWIKHRFGKDDQEAIEKKPESPETAVKTAFSLQEMAAKDPAFLDELRQWIGEIEAANIQGRDQHFGDTTMNNYGSGDIVGRDKHVTHNYGNEPNPS